MLQKIKEIILKIPIAYNFVQWLFASKQGKHKLVKLLDIQEGMCILDIGCGIGNLLKFFPQCFYTGYDFNPEYIKQAQKQYRNRPNTFFHCKEISTIKLPSELQGKCDRILALSVLHHLTDLQVQDFFNLAQKALKIGGKIITIDPTFIDNQNWIAKKLVGADRGQYVRHIKEYQYLYKKYFKKATTSYVDNFNRLPYNHALIIAEKKDDTF